MGCAEQTINYYYYYFTSFAKQKNWKMPSFSIFLFTFLFLLLMMFWRQASSVTACSTIFSHYFLYIPSYLQYILRYSNICGGNGWYYKSDFIVFYQWVFPSFIFCLKIKVTAHALTTGNLHVGGKLMPSASAYKCVCLYMRCACLTGCVRACFSTNLCEQFARQMCFAARYQWKLHSKIKLSWCNYGECVVDFVDFFFDFQMNFNVI